MQRIAENIKTEELLVAPTAMGQNPGGRLGEWAFNVLEIPDVDRRNPLLSLGKELLTHYDLMESLNLSDKRVTNFLRAMETKYGDSDNPYHCAAHATDVTANVHFLLQSGFVRCVNWTTHIETLSKFFSRFNPEPSA